MHLHQAPRYAPAPGYPAPIGHPAPMGHPAATPLDPAVEPLLKKRQRCTGYGVTLLVTSVLNLGWPAFFHGLYAMLILFGIGAIALEAESGGGL